MSVKTIETMVQWIEDNLDQNPTLIKMSDYVGYSSYYCSVKFHEVVGMSFQEYVSKRKLSLAAKELKETSHRIIDIAFKYGFSSNEAFTRAFCRTYGFTPNHLRRGRSVQTDYLTPSVIKKNTPFNN
jgi:AraC-like DNA-binding protein